MWKRNLKTFGKHLAKNKLYSLVTIFGFAISLTFVILLSIYIKNEYAINSNQVNKERIYRLRNESFDGFPPPMGQKLQDAYPEIESYTRVYDYNSTIDNNSGERLLIDFLMADSAFFDIFTFDLIEGTASEALKTKNSIVLTKNLAHKLFGNQPSLGKEVLIGNRIKFVVSGVVSSLSEGTHFKEFDGILNFRSLADLWGSEEVMVTYDNCSFGLYLLTKPNTNLPAKAPLIIESFKKDFWIYKENWAKELIFEPLTDVYFSEISGRGVRQNSKTLITVLGAIVFSILVLAIINYMNLTIAQSGLRVKETAIKKLVGSSRKSLIYQYLSESLLLCVLSFSIAVLLSFLAQPIFNNLLDTHINLRSEITGNMVIMAVVFVSSIGFLSGIVPAFVITKLNAIDVINGSFRRKNKGVYSRMLIGFQYVVVIVLLIATLIIAKQTQFLQTYNMGFDSKNILQIDFQIDKSQKEGLKNKLLTLPGVNNVSYVMGSPMDGGNNQSFMYNDQPVSFQELIVDSAFFTLMDMTYTETGAAYSKQGMWLNKTAVKTLGLDPLPQTFKRYGTAVPVLGIVNDFNYCSLHTPIGPVMIGQLADDVWPWSILVKIEDANIIATVEKVKETYSEYTGGVPFNYKFMDSTIESWYEKEVRTGKIVSYFTLLTIVIAVMGIFAMSTFYLQLKIKEIGVRKVNGAKVFEIIQLLNRDFVLWVALAFSIASPIAYFAINKWLQNFAYKTEISWWVFALAGVAALCIAIITISWQTFRAARRNPVEALRYE